MQVSLFSTFFQNGQKMSAKSEMKSSDFASELEKASGANNDKNAQNEDFLYRIYGNGEQLTFYSTGESGKYILERAGQNGPSKSVISANEIDPKNASSAQIMAFALGLKENGKSFDDNALISAMSEATRRANDAKTEWSNDSATNWNALINDMIMKNQNDWDDEKIAKWQELLALL